MKNLPNKRFINARKLAPLSGLVGVNNNFLQNPIAIVGSKDGTHTITTTYTNYNIEFRPDYIANYNDLAILLCLLSKAKYDGGHSYITELEGRKYIAEVTGIKGLNGTRFRNRVIQVLRAYKRCVISFEKGFYKGNQQGCTSGEYGVISSFRFTRYSEDKEGAQAASKLRIVFDADFVHGNLAMYRRVIDTNILLKLKSQLAIAIYLHVPTTLYNSSYYEVTNATFSNRLGIKFNKNTFKKALVKATREVNEAIKRSSGIEYTLEIVPERGKVTIKTDRPLAELVTPILDIPKEY